MSNIKVFEDKKIRTQWNEQEEDWYFSVVDVIAVLTDSVQPRKYWNDLKRKLSYQNRALVIQSCALGYEKHDKYRLFEG